MSFVTVAPVSVGRADVMSATSGVWSVIMMVCSVVQSLSVVRSCADWGVVLSAGVKSPSVCSDSVRDIIVSESDRLLCSS